MFWRVGRIGYRLALIGVEPLNLFEVAHPRGTSLADCVVTATLATPQNTLFHYPALSRNQIAKVATKKTASVSEQLTF